MEDKIIIRKVCVYRASTCRIVPVEEIRRLLESKATRTVHQIIHNLLRAEGLN